MSLAQRLISGSTVVVCVSAAIAYVSWAPEDASDLPSKFCFACGELATADALLNVAFYMPLGFAWGLTRVRFLSALALACLFSIVMEAGQIWIPGRFPSPLDVLTNSAGATLALFATRRSTWWIRPPPPSALRLCTLAATVAAATFVVTGYLLAPDLRPGTYVGQWTPRLGRYAHYDGVVSRVAIGPYDLPSTRIEPSDEVRRLLMQGEPLRIWATAGVAPASVSPIFGLVRSPRMQQLLVGASGEDLVVRIRHRGAGWRLHQHMRHARGLLAGVEPGSALNIEVWHSGATTCASVNESRDCTLGMTIGSGWQLVLHTSRFGDPRIESPLDFAWLALLTLPVGFWVRRAAPFTLPLLLVSAGAFLAPLLTSMAPTPAEGWAAMAVGFAAGIAGKWLTDALVPENHRSVVVLPT